MYIFSICSFFTLLNIDLIHSNISVYLGFALVNMMNNMELLLSHFGNNNYLTLLSNEQKK
jgi:hypothetical protein